MKLSTERDYHRRIARAIEAILREPGAPHTLESLAAIAHFSPYHFHRIYRALTGETVAETIQRLRLAQAAHQLKDNVASITTIALDAGYESPPAFARAFRGFAGISPSAFRAQQTDLRRPQTAMPSQALNTGALTTEGTNAAQVDIIDLPACDALCLRHRGPTAMIGQTFRALFQSFGTDAPPASSVIGIGFGDPEETSGYRYYAGIVADRAAPSLTPVGEIEAIHVAGGLYATYRLVGPWTLIAPTFQTLFGGWLPHSGYDPDDRPALEIYRHRASPQARHECVTDLLLPIRGI